MDCVLDGQAVMQIHWHREDWTIRRSEMLTQPEAMMRLAIETNQEIESAKEQIKPEHPSKVKIAAKLGISTSTLQKRMAMVKNHLPQPASTP